MKVRHYLTVGGIPYCHWLGTLAGASIARKAGVYMCGCESGADARHSARQLQRYFAAPVQAVRGDCPESLVGRN